MLGARATLVLCASARALRAGGRLAPQRASWRPSSRALAAFGGGEGTAGDAAALEGTRLYAPTARLASGFIETGTAHRVYYETYGNPAGKPALFVHGGPGGGTTPTNARFFDPESYYVVLVDQRGCGKSTPFACLEENTTWDLVADLEAVRATLGVETWQVFGGSWGSTLALAYAVRHPDRASELVLRGVFLVRAKELAFLYEGEGTNFVFPEAWERFAAEIPAREAADVGYVAAYGRRLRGELGEDAMRRACRAWSVWEGSVSQLEPPPAAAIDAKWADDDFALAFARIENHYFTSGGAAGAPAGFFERDGWLLEPAQLDRIRAVPTVIVQGRYDVVCPATSAYELHRALPHSDLHVVTTGHSSLEPAIIEKLVDATDAFRAS